MKPVAEIGFGPKDLLRPLSLIEDESEKAGYQEIIDFQQGAGQVRKALHSELVMTGAGTEILALFSEHTTNATLPGGTYSLPPFRSYLEIGHAVLEDIHHAAGVAGLLTSLADKVQAVGGVPSVDTADCESVLSGEVIELPGFLSTPLPTPSQWNVFSRCIASATTIAEDQSMVNALSRDDILRILSFLLLASGVPLKNLIRYRKYYNFGSFIFVDGEPLYFAALMRQTDVGLGLLPVRLVRPRGFLNLFSALRRRREPLTTRRLVFGDFQWDARLLWRSVRSALPSNIAKAPPDRLKAVLDRGATLTSLLNIGGFLTTALRDSLLIPANYYHVADLLVAKGFTRNTLQSFDMQPWEDPYAPLPKALAAEPSMEELHTLLQQKIPSSRGKGRPRQLPKKLRNAKGDVSDSSVGVWASTVAHFWARPSKARIKKLLVNAGATTAAGGWARAVEVFNRIAADGSLRTARPLRLIPPNDLAKFVTQVVDIHIPATEARALKRLRTIEHLRSIAALGVRPQEAVKISPEYFSNAKALRLLRLRGTKGHRAKREPSLHIFADGPCGRELFAAWESSISSASDKAESSVKPDPSRTTAGNVSGGHYTELNRALDAAFCSWIGQVSGRDASYTGYALRHATVIRLVQAAIDQDFLRGNFQAGLALAASSLGHSYPVFLSHYLGTAALLLSWPLAP